MVCTVLKNMCCRRIVDGRPGRDVFMGGSEQNVYMGRGIRGALSMAAAAWIPQGCKCAVRNPMPADLHFESAEEEQSAAYVDILNFAELMRGELLLGTGMMDDPSSVSGQFAAFSRTSCAKRHLRYPKYGHERINHFENEVLKFFAFS